MNRKWERKIKTKSDQHHSTLNMHQKILLRKHPKRTKILESKAHNSYSCYHLIHLGRLALNWRSASNKTVPWACQTILWAFHTVQQACQTVLRACFGDIFLIVNWYWRAQPTMSHIIHRQVDQGCNYETMGCELEVSWKKPFLSQICHLVMVHMTVSEKQITTSTSLLSSSSHRKTHVTLKFPLS